MMDPRVSEYEARHNCRLAGFMGPGPGQDGFVLRSDRVTAVKFFDRIDRFRRELEVYQGELMHWDDELRVIEMSIVDRPFLLDFAGAKRPGEVPDFEQHVLDEYEERLRDLFDERWTDAVNVAEQFRRMTGFVLMDIHPGNIAFPD